MMVVMMPPSTWPGDNGCLLDVRYATMGDGQLLGVEVVLVQRELAAKDELNRLGHLLVDPWGYRYQWRSALLVFLILGIAGWDE